MLASSNHPEKLDEALKRPGRFDVHVEFKNAVRSQVIDLYKHFYPLSEYASSTAPGGTESDTVLVTPEGDETSLMTTPEKSADTVVVSDELSQGFTGDDDLIDHATKLASSVLETGAEISMASLQGYLLKYKRYPKRAVEDAEAWAREVKGEQDEKIRKKEERRKLREERRGVSVTPLTPVSLQVES